MATPKAGEDAERLKPVRQRRRESQPPAERAPPERVSVSQRAAGTQGVGGGVAAAGPVPIPVPRHSAPVSGRAHTAAHLSHAAMRGKHRSRLGLTDLSPRAS